MSSVSDILDEMAKLHFVDIHPLFSLLVTKQKSLRIDPVEEGNPPKSTQMRIDEASTAAYIAATGDKELDESIDMMAAEYDKQVNNKKRR